MPYLHKVYISKAVIGRPELPARVWGAAIYRGRRAWDAAVGRRVIGPRVESRLIPKLPLRRVRAATWPPRNRPGHRMPTRCQWSRAACEPGWPLESGGPGNGLSFVRLVAQIGLVFPQLPFVPPRKVIPSCSLGLFCYRQTAGQLQVKGSWLSGDIGLRLKRGQAKDKTDKTTAEACLVPCACAWGACF